MSTTFKPFTFKKKSFALVDQITAEAITLKGRDGEMKVDVGAIKTPEIGQTIYLTLEGENYILTPEAAPTKTGKGNPIFTQSQQAQFDAAGA